MKLRTAAFDTAMAQQCRPEGKVKITIGSKTFNADEIVSVEKYHRIDPLSREIPTEQVDFSILDFAGTYGSYSAGTLVSVEWGLVVGSSTEWLSPDDYFLVGKPSIKENVVTYTATSKWTQWERKIDGRRIKTQCSYIEEAETVLEELFREGDPDYTPVFTPNLANCNLVGLPNESLKNCIQLVLHSVGKCAKANGDYVSFYTLFPVGNTSQKTLTLKDVLEGGFKKVKNATLYSTDTSVYKQKLVSGGTLYEGTIDVLANKPIKCYYESELAIFLNVTVNVTFNSGSGTYTVAEGLHFVELTFSQNANVSITISGPQYEESEEVVKTIWGADGRGGRDEEYNPLITNKVQANILAAQTANWLSCNVGYVLQTRGNPEIEALDFVTITRPEGGTELCLVVGNATRYDGTFTGELELISIEGATGFLPATEITYTNSGQTQKIYCRALNYTMPAGIIFKIYCDGNYLTSTTQMFNIRQYIHDANDHEIYFVTIKSGFHESEPSNMLIMNTMLEKYPTPNIGITAGPQHQVMLVVYNGSLIGSGVEKELYVDGALVTTFTVSSIYLDTDVQIPSGTHTATVKALGTIGGAKADSDMSAAVTFTI